MVDYKEKIKYPIEMIAISDNQQESASNSGENIIEINQEENLEK